VIDLDDPLAAEHDENVLRKPFAPSEAVAIGEAIREREREKAKERQREHGKTAPGKKKITSGNFPEVSEPRPRDIAGTAVGMSGKSYMKAKAVVRAADKDANFVYLVEEMDQTGNVSAAYRQLPKTGQDLVFVGVFGAVSSAAVDIQTRQDARCDASGCPVTA
jgi:hypothetical protein